MICPICGSEKLKKFEIKTNEAGRSLPVRLLECQKCRLVFANDFQKDRIEIYDKKYAAWSQGENEKKEAKISAAKKNAFRNQIKNISKLLKIGAQVLDVGAGNGYLLECLGERGWNVWGTEISSHSAAICQNKFPGKIFKGKLTNGNFSENFFDAVFLTDVLEHLADPKETVEEIYRILKPGGYLFLISPNFDSWSRKILGKRWFQYKYEHVFYFNKKSLEYLLENSGFRLMTFKNNSKNFSLAYYYFYFEKYSFLSVGKFLRFIFRYLSERIQNFSFLNPITGEFLAIAKKNEERQ
jgi:2-polyprenyl-3-methyl-5-hydroxy-6-metoxy-1,4-benzoquinol methylase